MGYPKSFYYYPLSVPIPENVWANPNPKKWAEQRFVVGNRTCRMIGLKLYRFFASLPDEQCQWTKEELVNAVFDRHDRTMGANISNVGRHLVNAVIYQPVFQYRPTVDGEQVSRMSWRFHSPRDVEYGVALQIGVWLPDHMLRHYAEYRSPADFREDTLAQELKLIREMPEREMYEMLIDIVDHKGNYVDPHDFYA